MDTATAETVLKAAGSTREECAAEILEKPEEEESSGGRKLWGKSNEKLCDAGPGNAPCDVCTAREPRAFKSCLVFICLLTSDLSHFRFPCAFKAAVLFTA